MIDQILEILFEEDNPRIVAIYGGGFKPPTKGHFAVVEKTLADFPEIDELIVYVGGGVRDGITQEESIKIWEIYKNYLSPKVKILPSIAPVKSVLDYAKENPTDKIYWVLGAREGDEDDIKDIENRTRSVEKYPNLEVKVITTKGGVSGTKTRQAVKAGNKEQFFHFIPDVEEKEEIWALVTPVVKEIKNKRAEIIKAKKAKMETKKSLEEGFIENTQENMKKLLLAIKQEGKETRDAFKLVLQAAKGEIQLTDEQKKQIGDQLKDVLKSIGLISIAILPGSFIVGALIKIFKAERLVFPSSLLPEVGEANLKPYKWEETDVEGYFVYTRFITDSETQYDVDLESRMYVDDDFNNLRALGVEFAAKPKGAEGSSTKIVVNKGELYRVMATIVDIVKKYVKKSKAQVILYSPAKKSSEEDFGSQRDNLYKTFISKAFPGVKFEQEGEIVAAILPNAITEADPKKGTGKKPEGSGRRLYTDEDPKDTVGIKFKTKEDIVDTLNKASFKAKSHARQSQIINLIHQRVRAAYEKAKDPEVKSRLKRALDYIESRKESSKEKTKRLNKMKEASDPQGTALPYGLGFAPIKESDPFGLNEFAKQFVKEVFEEGWNFEEGMVSLTKYMIDNGMNIKPLPKIKVIDNDKDNASKLLGKTAHYDPNEKSITLFTMNRHPKDVLRSFAHEMIHHEQNLEGRLGNINTTNTSEDGHLDKIEREAIEIGGIMLRNWEDSIKAEKYLKEYKQKALTELFEKDLPNIEKTSKNRYLVSNKNDIEAEYIFDLVIPEKNIWSLNWYFTPKNTNTSPEAWKQVTTTSFKVLKDWLQTNSPKSIHISGNTGTKTKLYKTYIDKLQTLLNNKYKIDNSDEDKVVLRSIEEIAQSGIKKRMETLNESYQQALYYWQNGDVNSKSKIERWDSIKKKIQREVLCELYSIKNV